MTVKKDNKKTPVTLRNFTFEICHTLGEQRVLISLRFIQMGIDRLMTNTFCTCKRVIIYEIV